MLAILSSILLTVASTADSRELAARSLESALAHESIERVRPLVDEACAELGADSRVRSLLVQQGRQLDVLDELGESRVPVKQVAELRSIIDDLRFEPLMESNRPLGFPAPTPVREIQVVRLPAYRLARTSMEGRASRGAFWKLFQHIQSNDIPMTAPVETTLGTSGDESAMAFLYESLEQPRGEVGQFVNVEDVPAHYAVSFGMRGRMSESRLEVARLEIERWLAAHPQWIADGPLRTMGYNSPMVSNRRRFFEVQIPVRSSDTTLIDFTQANEAELWRAMDDSVMGGRSRSRLEWSESETSLFVGTMSTANNGGFASVRTTGERCSMPCASCVVMCIRGDGQRYRLRLRSSLAARAPNWQAEFQSVNGEWSEVALPLDSFEPTWRGRRLADQPPLVPVDVVGLGLMIADGQVGEFLLELDSIRWR